MNAVESPAASWSWGASDQGVVHGEYLAATFRLVALGPSVGVRQLDPRVADVAAEALHQQITNTPPMPEATMDLARVFRRVDRAIRDRTPDIVSPATVVACSIRDGRAWFAHTGEGSAYLLRNGQLRCVVQPLLNSKATLHQRRRARGPNGRSHPGEVPWVGTRTEGDEKAGVMMRTNASSIHLRAGDRIVLCTTASFELGSIPELIRVIGQGPPFIAAQALSEILHLRDGVRDVAVALVDWNPEADTGETVENQLDGALFAGFSDLINEITDSWEVEPLTPTTAEREVVPFPTVPVMGYGQRTAVTDPAFDLDPVTDATEEVSLISVSPGPNRPSTVSPAPASTSVGPELPVLQPPSALQTLRSWFDAFLNLFR